MSDQTLTMTVAEADLPDLGDSDLRDSDLRDSDLGGTGFGGTDLNGNVSRRTDNLAGHAF